MFYHSHHSPHTHNSGSTASAAGSSSAGLAGSMAAGSTTASSGASTMGASPSSGITATAPGSASAPPLGAGQPPLGLGLCTGTEKIHAVDILMVAHIWKARFWLTTLSRYPWWSTLTTLTDKSARAHVVVHSATLINEHIHAFILVCIHNIDWQTCSCTRGGPFSNIERRTYPCIHSGLQYIHNIECRHKPAHAFVMVTNFHAFMVGPHSQHRLTNHSRKHNHRDINIRG